MLRLRKQRIFVNIQQLEGSFFELLMTTNTFNDKTRRRWKKSCWAEPLPKLICGTVARQVRFRPCGRRSTQTASSHRMRPSPMPVAHGWINVNPASTRGTVIRVSYHAVGIRNIPPSGARKCKSARSTG
jgi:hypothetical protein